jgi:rhamnose transport system ATP-binding protein
MRAGLGFVPEDRRQQGLVMDLSIARNTSLTRLRALARTGLIRGRAENSLAEEWGARLQLKYHRLSDSVGTLSGGNQQKVVLAKWLATGPKVLIVDEPTRGIDIGARGEIQALINELAAAGLGVLMISSDLEELVEGSSRVVVLRDGTDVAVLQKEQISQDAIIRAMAGGSAAAPDPVPES